MHKCVHTCLPWLQPTGAYARMEIAVSQFKELLESVTLHGMITAFVAVAATTKREFRNVAFCLSELDRDFLANTKRTYLCVKLSDGR